MWVAPKFAQVKMTIRGGPSDPRPGDCPRHCKESAIPSQTAVPLQREPFLAPRRGSVLVAKIVLANVGHRDEPLETPV